MDTKTKAFDAVAESRKWREATSRKLDSMTLEERLPTSKACASATLPSGKAPARLEQRARF